MCQHLDAQKCLRLDSVHVPPPVACNQSLQRQLSGVYGEGVVARQAGRRAPSQQQLLSFAYLAFQYASLS